MVLCAMQPAQADVRTRAWILRPQAVFHTHFELDLLLSAQGGKGNYSVQIIMHVRAAESDLLQSSLVDPDTSNEPMGRVHARSLQILCAPSGSSQGFQGYDLVVRNGVCMSLRPRLIRMHGGASPHSEVKLRMVRAEDVGAYEAKFTTYPHQTRSHLLWLRQDATPR